MQITINKNRDPCNIHNSKIVLGVLSNKCTVTTSKYTIPITWQHVNRRPVEIE